MGESLLPLAFVEPWISAALSIFKWIFYIPLSISLSEEKLNIQKKSCQFSKENWLLDVSYRDSLHRIALELFIVNFLHACSYSRINATFFLQMNFIYYG